MRAELIHAAGATAGMQAVDVAPNATRELALRTLGFRQVAGLDEVGRGCLAGPVVAAAVVFHPSALEMCGPLAAVRDSKLLRPAIRESLCDVIWDHATVGVGVTPVDTIERLGIVPATRIAMLEAIAALPIAPDHLLIDYLTLPDVALPQEGIVYGDLHCFSIAAASIIAKVLRDHLMIELDKHHPGYGLARHKGYGTPEHVSAMARLGPCPIHRRNFAPVRALLNHDRETPQRIESD